METWLAIACVILLALTLYPVSGIELASVLDWKGGNQYTMEVKEPTYHCGDMVQAQMIFQKTRPITGTIRWALIPNSPEHHMDLYPVRTAASPVGIYNLWADIEKIPEVCAPGKYHFEGTITYPLLLGRVTYDLRTKDFEVKTEK
jgi:hypothetical protein